MANYYASARSNYFGVKDIPAFKEWCEKRNLTYWRNDAEETENSLFAIYPNEQYNDTGSWPNYDYDDDTGVEEEFEISDEICDHLKDGHVAILMEVGNEKLRFLAGVAIAVNNKGEFKEVNLHWINNLARELGDHVDLME